MIQIDLDGVGVLIVGGGRVAARKADALIEAGAVVKVVSPRLGDQMRALHTGGYIRWIDGLYHRDHLLGYLPRLVIAATSNPAVNAQVVADANYASILVNRVDEPADSSFTNVMMATAPPLSLALSSNGASPALSKRLRDRLEEVLKAYQPLARWLGELRPIIKQRLPQAQRRALWRQLTTPAILDAAERGDKKQIRGALQTIVDEQLGENIWQPH